MTNRLLENALAEWLEANAPAELATVSWVVIDDTTEGGKTYPLGIVEATGSQEHEVAVGVYEMSLTVALETNPEDTSTADAATMKDALYCLLGDRPTLISGLDNRADLICWEARISSPVTTPNDGRRRDEFGLSVVCAAQVT